MKLLLLLAVLLFAVWLWRSARAGEHKAEAKDKPQPPTTPSPPEMTRMVQCRHCQLHLPLEEAALGVWGPYCGNAHRSAAGDKAPDA